LRETHVSRFDLAVLIFLFVVLSRVSIVSTLSYSISMRWFVAIVLSFLLSAVTADVCGPGEGLSACLDDWYGREAYSSHFPTSIDDYYNASLTGISRCKETFALSRCEKGGVFDLQVERPLEDRPCTTALTCGGGAECLVGVSSL
jgi:hypothetical protein